MKEPVEVQLEKPFTRGGGPSTQSNLDFPPPLVSQPFPGALWTPALKGGDWDLLQTSLWGQVRRLSETFLFRQSSGAMKLRLHFVVDPMGWLCISLVFGIWFYNTLFVPKLVLLPHYDEGHIPWALVVCEYSFFFFFFFLHLDVFISKSSVDVSALQFGLTAAIFACLWRLLHSISALLDGVGQSFHCRPRPASRGPAHTSLR